MVRINRVHTGAGDEGETSLLDGSRVGKQDDRVGLFGTIDELNSQIGVVRMEISRSETLQDDHSTSADDALGLVQQELFDIGGECSCPPDAIPVNVALVGSEQADRLVSEMDGWLEDLEPLESFILPTGSAPVATMHVARTVARRAEREACALREKEGVQAVRPEVMAYLNRLSDWLFILARWIARGTGEVETPWTPLGERGS
ncbi:MAG: cob(I)yrinic acid a,c-diamide adenosyltransferase [Candidatus Thermoplasmatota archaeon]|jgi:cob(I)alamin adenosyltransferase|uniref:Cobalamin adenosyltransferase-like domain-containing protein n=1 Tax=marine metagenome TaxID=408172 RepID=A0A381QUL2_9ZZZZ|nr:ATP:cob(I)alamin adenosyltransferase [Euryarchaeota archaeon]MEC7700871.1 cob(I)yrinic acid a,c-diamide adenosyltransferase [Candidatus Thermoplasmatota archaeon]MEE3114379.1 cob(I)yrinic acid a,c-diamide adenosyltransferase [Candidatus Thermoplasmatota archaeon]|tara:strand:+ start:2785 stop:3393 length:609 start_codon:yes stop_codon:yes gene_type:complete